MKVIRWIVIIVSAIGVIGSVLGLTTGDTGSKIWVLAFWFVIGAVALYFELKSNKQERK